MALLNKTNLTLVLCIVCIFVLLVSCESFFGGDDAEKEIPVTKLGQVGGPTMTFLYCYSCGYRKAFEDYVNIINEKYPHMTLNGGNYDPPGMNLYVSKAVFALKVLLIVVIVSSYDLFGAIGVPSPSWWQSLLDNKLYACMMIFFIGNLLESQLVSSGAFEIHLNGVPVWSKLQTGRIPSPQELFQIIESHLKLSGSETTAQDNPDFVK